MGVTLSSGWRPKVPPLLPRIGVLGTVGSLSPPAPYQRAAEAHCLRRRADCAAFPGFVAFVEAATSTRPCFLCWPSGCWPGPAASVSTHPRAGLHALPAGWPATIGRRDGLDVVLLSSCELYRPFDVAAFLVPSLRSACPPAAVAAKTRGRRSARRFLTCGGPRRGFRALGSLSRSEVDAVGPGVELTVLGCQLLSYGGPRPAAPAACTRELTVRATLWLGLLVRHAGQLQRHAVIDDLTAW